RTRTPHRRARAKDRKSPQFVAARPRRRSFLTSFRTRLRRLRIHRRTIHRNSSRPNRRMIRPSSSRAPGPARATGTARSAAGLPRRRHWGKRATATPVPKEGGEQRPRDENDQGRVEERNQRHQKWKTAEDAAEHERETGLRGEAGADHERADADERAEE